MKRRLSVGVVSMLLITSVATTVMAESVYLIAEGGRVRRLDTGVVIGGSFTDASLNLTRLAVGNGTAPGGLQVGVGDNVGGVHVIDGALTAQTGFTDINGASNNPVTAIAVGSIGGNLYAIAAAHLRYDQDIVALGNLRGSVYILNSTNTASLTQIGNVVNANPGAPNILFPAGTPNTYVDAAIGETDTSSFGNELILGHHQLNSDGSRVASAVQEAGKVREVVSIGGVNSTKRDHTMNNFLTGIALGDVRAPGEDLNPGGPDDLIQFGADNGAPARTNRNSWQAFSRSPGAGGFPNFNFLNFNAANQASAIVDAVIGEVMAGAFGTPPNDPAAPDLRNEVVSVGKELSSGGAGAAPTGNGVIEISNTFSGGCCLQQIVVPNENLTSVALADILDNDGVAEIIAGGALGNVMVFRHAVVGDLTSQFATAPVTTLNIGGGILELAKEFKGRLFQSPQVGPYY